MPYEKNGIQYPSVTTITGILDKPALIAWSSNCAVDFIAENIDAVRDPIDVHRGEDILSKARKAYAQKRDSAADSGTLCHRAIEIHIQGADDSEITDMLAGDEQAKRGYSAFLEWEESNHLEWIETECEVISEEFGYAGRFDAIAKVNGVLYLIDFKTSSGVYDEMKWQVCAYRQAYNEDLPEGSEIIEKMAILHLDKKTGEPTFHPVTKGIMRMTAIFNQLVTTYYILKNRRLKNNPFVERMKGLDG